MPDEDVIGPGPEHGDNFDPPEPEAPEQEELEPEAPDPDPKDQEIAALKREMESLKRSIPPAEPAQPSEPEEPDYGELIFTDPNEALRLHGEAVEKRVREQVKREYDQDQGTKKFWDQFFQKFPDLKNDSDLVEATLNGNLSQLADLPIEQAIDKLGSLTRNRISRYRGSENKRPKATAEGAGAPAPKAAEPPKDNVTTLSDIIKQRRNKRRGAAA